MSSRLFAVITLTTIGLMSSTGFVSADPLGRYECNIVGNGNPEPVGDRAGHALVNMQYVCRGVEGLVKGAVFSANGVTEWDGPKGTFLLAGGTHRVAGGFAVTSLIQGTALVIMKDDKPVGMTSAGTASVKFATGALSALAGKTYKFATQGTGFNQFEMLMED
jgi:hypothetical protein